MDLWWGLLFPLLLVSFVWSVLLKKSFGLVKIDSRYRKLAIMTSALIALVWVLATPLLLA